MTTPYRQPTPNGQWYQFDPNVHFYYDDQGRIHYYDPNTNQECHYQPPPTQYQPHYQTPPTSHYPANYQPQAAHYPPYNYPPPISRQATPDVLLPCPEPPCTGENKPKSKFCEECGRPLE
ncbi:hypothetical protein G6F68_018886 [Rhizopus microsporus]|nr:hypothetical protein G6F68_018886 [Rhizopus microsporus]